MTGTSPPLAGKVALVTGVSRRQGIGGAVARRLTADGATLFLHSWAPHDDEQPWGADPGGTTALLAGIHGAGGRAEHISADFAHVHTPALVIETARSELGHVDIVVANHARSSAQDLRGLTAEELDRTLAVNVRGTLLLLQAFSAQHDGRPGGRVVLFTSGQYHGAMPGELPYVASKAALHGLTRSLAVDLAPRKITVNCIDPGPNDTGWADPATLDEVTALHPGGRWSTPADTAELVAWLVSDGAGWVTGQTIASDGGWSSR